MVTPGEIIVNKPYCYRLASVGEACDSAGMDLPSLADATSPADIPGVRLLGLVVGGLLLLAAIRAMFGRR
ncbi:hypothetical protein GA0070216_10788 [Micromonospora matsumotoense]|uniref:Uncharacterized protein n=1 Tax=Micromonospora matsumotoense TaxID=121616 RepID=A0A1C4YRF6_9ACTN|nr:hypothetical protein GA0070216_10788 [Micromonospora matsumotoense]